MGAEGGNWCMATFRGFLDDEESIIPKGLRDEKAWKVIKLWEMKSCYASEYI